MADEKNRELFKRYKDTGDIALRNEIAEKYLYIADILAKKFVGRGVEYDDLKQVASYALLRGIDRFDPELGMQFTTFITPTITGEIKNYFRDKSRLVKFPRRLGEINAAARKYSVEYETKNGVKPDVKQIAAALSLPEEDVIKALEIGGTLSLDSMAAETEGDASLYALLPKEEENYERFELKETLRSAMKNFTETERKLIKYRYEDELSQSETARRLGVSQMFVSRMERKLLLKLKENLRDSIEYKETNKWYSKWKTKNRCRRQFWNFAVFLPRKTFPLRVSLTVDSSQPSSLATSFGIRATKKPFFTAYLKTGLSSSPSRLRPRIRRPRQAAYPSSFPSTAGGCISWTAFAWSAWKRRKGAYLSA